MDASSPSSLNLALWRDDRLLSVVLRGRRVSAHLHLKFGVVPRAKVKAPSQRRDQRPVACHSARLRLRTVGTQ